MHGHRCPLHLVGQERENANATYHALQAYYTKKPYALTDHATHGHGKTHPPNSLFIHSSLPLPICVLCVDPSLLLDDAVISFMGPCTITHLH